MNRELKTVWETYVAAWKAETIAEKQALFAACVAPACVYSDPLTQAKGWDELLAYMLSFHQQIRGGHFVTEYFLGHHGRSIARWNMRNAEGHVVGHGTSFGEYDEQPRLRIGQLDDPGYGLAAKITGLGAHIILLHIGTNDLIQQVDVPRAPARLGTLLDHLIVAAPNALIVVAQLIPCRFDYAKCDGRVITYNAAIADQVRARAAAGKHVALVDMHAVLPLSSLGDEIHPNDAGYAAMANAWYARIGPLLQPK